MKSLLWIQSDSPIGEDYLYIDNQLTSQNDVEYEKGIKKIHDVQSSIFYSSKKMNRFRKFLNSPNFIIYCNPINGFLFKSIFNEKSVDGRKKTIIYWCKYSESNRFDENIERFSKNIGYTLRANDISFAKDYIRKRNVFFKNSIRLGIGLGLTIIAALLLCNYNESK